ncbi:MAG: cob(I)yrinic acid a,c-diamide adenosyltransferase [Rubrobacteridae bacterium]|nr:cob(I)yrinic acid a,c-diamide adenosyltransferase [Rubrobacteridae bacterium]
MMEKKTNKNERLGQLHIYTGDGKGKTTAAIGLALRALGSGLKVRVFQFMKAESDISGEIKILSMLANVSVERHGGNTLKKTHKPLEEIKIDIKEGLNNVRNVVEKRLCDLIVLDEINVALSTNLADLADLLGIVESAKENNIEIIMTGRNAPVEIIETADYVTELKLIKHPFGDKRVGARQGIEY